MFGRGATFATTVKISRCGNQIGFSQCPIGESSTVIVSRSTTYIYPFTPYHKPLLRPLTPTSVATVYHLPPTTTTSSSSSSITQQPTIAPHTDDHIERANHSDSIIASTRRFIARPSLSLVILSTRVPHPSWRPRHRTTFGRGCHYVNYLCPVSFLATMPFRRQCQYHSKGTRRHLHQRPHWIRQGK